MFAPMGGDLGAAFHGHDRVDQLGPGSVAKLDQHLLGLAQGKKGLTAGGATDGIH
jgi:hypothetical protein